MRYLIILLSLFFSFSALAQAELFGSGNSLSSSSLAEPEFLKVDEAFQFSSEQSSTGLKLHWSIADDYYLYKERFKFSTKTEGVTLGEAEFSKTGKAKQDPYFGEVHVIYGKLNVYLPIALTGTATEAEVKVTYQGCAEAGLCYPPRHQTILFVPGEAVDSTSPIKTSELQQAEPSTQIAGSLNDANSIFAFIQSSSLLTIIAIFFLLGLGLTFTPCVFPMIPIVTSIIAGQEKPSVYKSFLLSLSYVLGMAITYAAAGTVTGLLGASANVQAALQSPLLLSVFATIFVLLALAMFGFYELQLPSFIRDRLNTTSQNLSGGHLSSVFLIGALSALIVSPCVSAPLAGALIYISSTGDAILGGLSLFALGMGMGVPLILIAIGGGKWLPRAGAWMDKVKAVFGIMLLAVAIWLLSRFVDAQIIMVLWATLSLITGIQLGAFEKADYGWPRTFKAIGLILSLYAVLLFIGAAQGNTNPLKPITQISSAQLETTATSSLSFKTIYSLEALNTALAQNNNITMLDFYADWCISCKIMENQVFPLPNIHSKMTQMNLIKADVTENDDSNKALLEHFKLFGPPSILFFDANGNELEELRIVGEIGPNEFDTRLALALKMK